jgi:glutathione synthase/RimK-type ligase-like ATP-grasp enzyme
MRVALVTGRSEVTYQVETDRPLVEALERAGAVVEEPDWRDAAVDWQGFDVAVVRTTWDYTADRDGFVAWAEQVGAVTTLVNDADVLRWNTHKSYLLELEERGAPTVPTAWLARGDRCDLAALVAERGWACAIVKPAVASGSDGLLRVVAADAASAGQAHLDGLLATGDALVQPYLAAIETSGELSVVVLDGEVSHAVRKRPSAGEFRIQEQYGGRYVREEPSPAVAELARWVVGASGADLAIARVDLVAADDGTPQLVELEATEPDLYLALAPDGAARLADLILARAVRSS